MLSLNEYKEYGGNYPSMKNYFEEQPYEGMEQIIDYLNNAGEITFSVAEVPTDAFTGEFIKQEEYGKSDGEYCWMSTLPYYVKKYNLRLSAAFEKYVHNKKFDQSMGRRN